MSGHHARPGSAIGWPSMVPEASASARISSGLSRQSSSPPVAIRQRTSGAWYSASVANSPPKSCSGVELEDRETPLAWKRTASGRSLATNSAQSVTTKRNRKIHIDQ
jgi:hypothetical protein